MSWSGRSSGRTGSEDVRFHLLVWKHHRNVCFSNPASSSEADMDYQDFSGSDDSDSDDSFYLALSPEAFFLQNRSPAPHQDHEGSEAPSPLK